MPEVVAVQTRARALTWLSALHIARASVAIVGVTIVPLLFVAQMSDMLADLSDGGVLGVLHSLAFGFALLFLAFNVWHWSRAAISSCLQFDERDSRKADNGPRIMVPRLLFIAAMGAGAIATFRSAEWAQFAIVIILAALCYFLLVQRASIQEKLFGKASLIAGGDPQIPKWIPAPLQAVFLSLGRLLRYAPTGYWIAFAGLALAIVAGLLGAAEAHMNMPPSWPGLSFLIAKVFPGPGAFLFCIALTVAPLTALTSLFDQSNSHIPIPVFKKKIPVRYIPVLILLGLLVVLTPQWVNLHGVRTVTQSNALTADQRTDLGTYFKNWADKCQSHNKVVYPIIVAASGGATRAGMWSARVLAEVNAASAGTPSSLFAISSVSGGSLGPAAYLSTAIGEERTGKFHCGQLDPTKDFGQVSKSNLIEALRSDNIGPALAAALFGDTPRAIFGIPLFVSRWIPSFLGQLTAKSSFAEKVKNATLEANNIRGGDRAEAIERSFEQHWRNVVPSSTFHTRTNQPANWNEPYLSLFYSPRGTPGDLPLWIANGTDNETGGRILTIPVTFKTGKPFLGAHDAIALLGMDVPISTAIDNTARFPFIGPVGELDNIKPSENAKPAQIMDGGYFENEGLLTALELAHWLKKVGANLIQKKVDPIIVQATDDGDGGWDKYDNFVVRCGNANTTNDPETTANRSRPSQLLAPLEGINSVRGGHSDLALRQAREEFCNGKNGPRFFHLYLYSPDGKPIPLNWVLSEKTGDEIWDGVINAKGNVCERYALRQTLRSLDLRSDSRRQAIEETRTLRRRCEDKLRSQ